MPIIGYGEHIIEVKLWETKMFSTNKETVLYDGKVVSQKRRWFYGPGMKVNHHVFKAKEGNEDVTYDVEVGYGYFVVYRNSTEIYSGKYKLPAFCPG